MLPDLPSLKRALAERLRDGLQAATTRHAPLLADIQTHHHREGDRFSYETHEGDICRQTFKVFRTPVVTQLLPSPIEQEQEIDQKLEQAARDIAKQHMQLVFTTITEASQQAGTAYNAGGRPFEMGMFLDQLERMSIDFNEHGQPIFPTIIMHPSQMKAIEPRLAEWEKDRALQARWHQVIAQKKEEWRAREADRTLVG